jgi:predicted TIM-barrel fold metal-dependent hydrolase
MLPPSQPELVLQHLDWAGVAAAVFYGDTRKWLVTDPLLRIAMYRAYNDFCLELTAQQPQRLLYLPALSTRDVEACLPELGRLVEAGVRAVEFGVFDVGAPLYDPAWEPIWEFAAGHDVLICSHTGHPAGTPTESSQFGAFHAACATSPLRAARPIADMVFSGVFERHPRLKWVMAECRIGWLPFLFSWLDKQIEVRKNDASYTLSKLPSEFIRDHVAFTFEDDPVGAQLIGCEWCFLGEVAMWAMDYPHRQGMWPDPGPKIDAMFANVDAKMQHEILYQRAASLFHFDHILDHIQ